MTDVLSRSAFSRRAILGGGLSTLVLGPGVALASHALGEPRGLCQSCDPTGADIQGPFFKPGAPERTRLAAKNTPGTHFLLEGSIRDRGCDALAGAIVEVWQADTQGRYDNDGFNFRGRLTTDARGEFRIATILPGRYLNGKQFRPAHLHFTVTPKEGKALTTQLYFAGDPFNEVDPWFNASRALHLEKDGDRLTTQFQFVL